MKLYLSSYKLGSKISFLNSFINDFGKKMAYIPNALDFTKADPGKRKAHIELDLSDLRGLGFEVEVLNLKDYFGKSQELSKKLASVNSVWVSGGNTFVLRQAMRLSGFDALIHTELNGREDFLYAGYSAGCCVLSPELEHLQQVDDANDFPYDEIKEQIWEGLDIVDFAILPHYDSDHHESKLIEKEVQYCIDNKILFIALRDGEVILVS